MPEKFVYPLVYRLFYTLGSLPFSLLLIFYIVQIFLTSQFDTLHIVFLLLGISLLLLLNRKFIKLYKNLPLEISVKDDRIIAVKYFLSSKSNEILFSEITGLSGGIFDGKISGMIMLIDEKQNRQMVISDRIKNFNVLLTAILSKVNKAVYDEAISKIGKLKKINSVPLKSK
ncbi:MAG: hypothetical protein IPM56_15060 [Ignavibacteriales bacterium]|nr:MAG: hypothetical protein IPM56_15060 [Ignavibacteriales bacterium]